MTERTRVQREIDEITSSPITNTQIKFQLSQIKGKFNSLQTYWNRTLRAIEDGTYKRDRFRADLHDKERLEREGRRLDRDVRSAEAAAAGGGGGDPYDRVYQAYVQAKQKSGESTDGLSREKLYSTLKKQEEKLRKSGAQAEFRVVIREGKARIVAKKKAAQK